MNNYSTVERRNSNAGGAIQAAINCQELAAALLGGGVPGGDALVFVSPFNPDDVTGSLHVFKGYWRDASTGKRGGAIKLVQCVRGCDYGQAVAFLEGWELAKGAAA